MAYVTTAVRAKTTATTRLYLSDFVTPVEVPAPTDITLTAQTVAENAAQGAVIGTIGAAGGTEPYTFSLTDTGGGRAQVSGTQLQKGATALNFEVSGTFNITLRVTDDNSQTFDKQFTITVTNINEAPTDITWAGSHTVAEDASVSTVIGGSLSFSDPDAGATGTFTLTDDAGGLFDIDGTNVIVAGALDYETAASHNITVRFTDQGGLTYDEVFAVTVTDVVEAPPETSFYNDGGSDNRTADITVTTTATMWGGSAINNLIDGDFADDTNGSAVFDSGQSTREVKFDFGVPKIIDGFRWYQNGATSQGTWVLEGSTDDTNWTQVGDAIELGAVEITQFTAVNETQYRYYKLRQTSGATSNGPFIRELEFEIADQALNEDVDAASYGDRTAIITPTTTAVLGSGTIANLIDGAWALNSTDSVEIGGGQTLREIVFDFASGKVVTGYRLFQDRTEDHGTWVAEGSNDNTNWTGIGSSFTLGGARVSKTTWANSTSYRYLKLRQTSGSTSNLPWVREIEFLIDA